MAPCHKCNAVCWRIKLTQHGPKEQAPLHLQRSLNLSAASSQSKVTADNCRMLPEVTASVSMLTLWLVSWIVAVLIPTKACVCVCVRPCRYACSCDGDPMATSIQAAHAGVSARAFNGNKDPECACIWISPCANAGSQIRELCDCHLRAWLL